MLRFWVVSGTLCAALQAGAETIEFEADEGVYFVRCTEQYDGDASCELIFDQPNNQYTCVALDNKSRPMAVSYWPGWKKGAKFDAPIDVSAIADVKCRLR